MGDPCDRFGSQAGDTWNEKLSDGVSAVPNGQPSDFSRKELSDRVVAAYSDALKQISSPLVMREDAWVECERQARAIVADCLRTLYQEDTQPSKDAEFASLTLGAQRALQRIPVSESMRASYILMDIVLSIISEVVEKLPPDEALPRLVRATGVLHRSVGVRVQAAFIGYEAFMLRSVGAANSDHRAELAREIHDRIGGGLSLVLRSLELLEVGDHHGDRDRIEDAKQALQNVFQFIRDLVSGLHSTTPDLNLGAQVEEFAQLAAPAGTALEIQINGDEIWLPPPYQEEVFLVVQECLRNSFAHAEASRVAVEVNIAPHLVACCVEDDGVGSALEPGGDWAGSGIRSMRERVSALHGTFSFSSRPEAGTRVRFEVPLPRFAQRMEGNT